MRVWRRAPWLCSAAGYRTGRSPDPASLLDLVLGGVVPAGGVAWWHGLDEQLVAPEVGAGPAGAGGGPYGSGAAELSLNGAPPPGGVSGDDAGGLGSTGVRGGGVVVGTGGGRSSSTSKSSSGSSSESSLLSGESSLSSSSRSWSVCVASGRGASRRWASSCDMRIRAAARAAPAREDGACTSTPRDSDPDADTERCEPVRDAERPVSGSPATKHPGTR